MLVYQRVFAGAVETTKKWIWQSLMSWDINPCNDGSIYPLISGTALPSMVLSEIGIKDVYRDTSLQFRGKWVFNLYPLVKRGCPPRSTWRIRWPREWLSWGFSAIRAWWDVPNLTPDLWAWWILEMILAQFGQRSRVILDSVQLLWSWITIATSIWQRPSSWANYRGSWNRGTPQSSIFVGFSIVNHLYWGTPMSGNIHMRSPGDPQKSTRISPESEVERSVQRIAVQGGGLATWMNL